MGRSRARRRAWRAGIAVVLLALLVIVASAPIPVPGRATLAGPRSGTRSSGDPAATIDNDPTTTDRAGTTEDPTSAPTTAPIPARLHVTPATQSAHAQDEASVDVEITDAAGAPVSDVPVTFRVAGANAGATGMCAPVGCLTGPDGRVRFSYPGTALGADQVNVALPAEPMTGAAAVMWGPSIRGSAVAVLGDSFSAGEGTSDYLAGTAEPGTNTCHRSTAAYGPLIDRVKSLGSLAFRACSGAVTDDLFAANSGRNLLPTGEPEPAQLCVDCTDRQPAAVGPDTRAVALTIGGNDAGFSEVLAACIWVSELNLNYGRPGRGCSGRSGVVDPVAQRLAVLAAGSPATVSAPNGRPIHSAGDILARIHQLAPAAHVYLLGYPQLFQPGGGDCFLGRINVGYAGRQVSVATKITPADARWLDDRAAALDASYRAAATSAGPWATFVDVAGPFTGHGVCTGQSWINGDSGTLTVHSAQNIEATIDPGSFHPNPEGQRQYAAALEAAGLDGP